MLAPACVISAHMMACRAPTMGDVQTPMSKSEGPGAASYHGAELETFAPGGTGTGMGESLESSFAEDPAMAGTTRDVTNDRGAADDDGGADGAEIAGGPKGGTAAAEADSSAAVADSAAAEIAAGERTESAKIPGASASSTGGGGGSDSGSASAYDVESARRLLMQAQRRTDIIMTRQDSSAMGAASSSGYGPGGAAADGESPPRGVLAAAGRWLERLTEQRRQEELTRQVEQQRRRLKRAIKRRSASLHGEDDGDGDSSSGPVDDGDGGDDDSDDRFSEHRHGHEDGDRQDRPSHPHHGGGGGGGICSALTGTIATAVYGSVSPESSADGSTSTSESTSSHPKLLSSPIFTPSGSGLHVDIRMPNLPSFPNLSLTAPALSGTDVTVDPDEDEGDGDGDEDMVPDVTVDPEPPTKHKFCPHILSPQQMKSIATTVLPPSVRYCRWRRLYSLSRDGDSFDAFLRLVAGWKRTLLVVSTSRGQVLGAYAESPWESQRVGVGATFYGGAQACLWRVADRLSAGGGKEEPAQDNGVGSDGANGTNGGDGGPGGDIVAYRWTGANRYIQICDVAARQIALGGGGVDGDFGLCLEDDFRRGSTGPCETFGNDPLCDQDNFDIVDLECWGFPSGFA